MLDTAALTERVITVDELKTAEEIKLLNSVRGTWGGVLN